MAFRKSSYAKVFVDEGIPSFLVQHQKQNNAIIHLDAGRPPLAVRPQQGASLEQTAKAAPPSENSIQMDRRNRSPQIRPIFMMRLVLIAVALNAGLYVLLQKTPLLPLAKSSARGDVVSGFAVPEGKVEDRVVTYSVQPTSEEEQ